jgi:hypothetical protein
MAYRVTSEGRVLRLVGQMGARARNRLPATKKIGEYLAREARRRQWRFRTDACSVTTRPARRRP